MTSVPHPGTVNQGILKGLPHNGNDDNESLTEQGKKGMKTLKNMTFFLCVPPAKNEWVVIKVCIFSSTSTLLSRFNMHIQSHTQIYISYNI